MNSSALLRLLCLASPALPVGGFAYSEGLEAAVDAGLVSDEASAAGWLTDQFALSFARADLPAFCAALQALRAADHAELRSINAWLLQTRETAELRAQSVQMARSLRAWLANDAAASATQDPFDDADVAFPIRFAQACAPSGADLESAATAFAFSWAENMVQAALKAMPLGQSAGQRILAALSGQIAATVPIAAHLPRESWQSFTPTLAILSAQHEVQYSRLFRS